MKWCETYLEELAGVIVAIINADWAAINANVEANTEVLGHERVHTIRLKNHMAFKESSLGNTWVLNLGLSNHDTLVFEVVEHGKVVDAVVFKASLNNSLFKVTVESKHLQ